MLVTVSDPRDALPHVESLHALDWLNFFLAALLTGVGPFVAVKLADRRWMPAHIGLVLTVSGLAGLLTQIPAGELIDISKSKRLLGTFYQFTLTVGLTTEVKDGDPPTLFWCGRGDDIVVKLGEEWLIKHREIKPWAGDVLELFA